ncbi:DNA binding domain, excisionase family [Pseudogulbenkiania sp. NH8B]|uniref:helix-turn-helix domain-containing protein n=1 Tax=Pseudogulbenkiania sp. (strain NH8B) TaxID=748280 RepID=UPI0002279EDF|nr:helix-turn-helix domain-containing protein [Pseudogulbenkiania sp. NH8B]BAK76670.1 DNA binding domain, excisionase family [Pseudogulbenkiania sp. NH8B]
MTTELKPAVANAQNERFNTLEAARYLGVSASTLCSWRCTKLRAIKFYKIGSKVFYKKSDLDEFIAANSVEG